MVALNVNTPKTTAMRTKKYTAATYIAMTCLMGFDTMAQIPAEPVWGVDCLETEEYYAGLLADTTYFPSATIQITMADNAETPCNPGEEILFGDSIPYFHPLSGTFMEYVYRQPNFKTIHRTVTVTNSATQISTELQQDILAFELLPHSTDSLAQPFVYLGYGTIDYDAIYMAINDHPGELFDFHNGCGDQYNLDVLNMDNFPAIIDVYPWGFGSRAELYWRCSWGQNVKWYIQHVFINAEPFVPCPPASNDTLETNPCANDSIAPVFPDLPTLGFSCSDIPAVELPMVLDDLDASPSVIHLGDEGVYPCESFIIRTYQATDGCGNSSTAVQELYVNNMTNVWFIDPPSNSTITADAAIISPYDLPVGSSCYPGQVVSVNTVFAGNSVTVYAMAMASNCALGSGNITYSLTSTNVAFHAALQGYMQVALPGTIPPPVDLDSLNNNNIFFYFTLEEDTLFTDFRAGGDPCVVYTVTRTYRTYNTEGSELSDHSFIQVFDIIDEDPPILDVGPNVLVVDPDQIPAPSLNVWDDHGVEFISTEEEVVNELCPVSFTLIRTYTAIDSCGHQSVALQTIIVEGDCSTVGFVEPDAFASFSILVDPASGQVQITANTGPIFMEIFDALGRLVLSDGTGSNTLFLRIGSGYGWGTYVLRTTIHGSTRSDRIVLMH